MLPRSQADLRCGETATVRVCARIPQETNASKHPYVSLFCFLHHVISLFVLSPFGALT